MGLRGNSPRADPQLCTIHALDFSTLEANGKAKRPGTTGPLGAD